MTIAAGCDLAGRKNCFCIIALGTFHTPILARLSEDVRGSLPKALPHLSRLCQSKEFAMLASHIIENPMLHSDRIRLDGAIRMPRR
jgi:hypothetical protein